MPELKETIVSLSGRDDLTDWEATFLKSIGQFLDRKGRLTEGQRTVLGKIQHKYNEENLAKRDAWTESFTPTMRQNAIVMAHYYNHNPPYFQNLAVRVLNSPDLPLPEKSYRSMCENKYALRVLETYYSEPQFPAGTLAVMRDTQQVAPEYKGKTVFVDITADWCLTCQINKSFVLNRNEVVEIFKV